MGLEGLGPHLRNRIRQQGVELLVRAVPDAAPACRVEVLPDASQADGHPLAEQRVGVRQLLQAVGDEVPLETGLLGREEEQEEALIRRCAAQVGRYLWAEPPVGGATSISSHRDLLKSRLLAAPTEHSI